MSWREGGGRGGGAFRVLRPFVAMPCAEEKKEGIFYKIYCPLRCRRLLLGESVRFFQQSQFLRVNQSLVNWPISSSGCQPSISLPLFQSVIQSGCQPSVCLAFSQSFNKAISHQSASLSVSHSVRRSTISLPLFQSVIESGDQPPICLSDSQRIGWSISQPPGSQPVSQVIRCQCRSFNQSAKGSINRCQQEGRSVGFVMSWERPAFERRLCPY